MPEDHPETIDEILRRLALVGTCPTCGWETELRTVGETTRVIECPTCHTSMRLRRRRQ